MANSGWRPAERGHGGRGIVLPLLLIVVGSVLLLNNFGVLAWSVWPTLAQLWPVILVLVGIELILGRRTSVPGVIVAMLVIAVAFGWGSRHTSVRVSPVVAGVNQKVTPGAASQPSSTDSTSHVDVPLGDTQNAQVTLNFGAGDLQIGALPTGDANLVQADATLPDGQRLVKTSSGRDGKTDLTLTTEGQGGFFWPFANHGRQGDSLAVSLAQKVPLSLQTNLGAGQSELDFSDLAVQTLDVNSGAGRVTLQLPKSAGQTRANIRSGAGDLTLIVPPNVGAYLHTTNGLVSIQLPPGRYTQVGDGYQSNNYATAANQIDIYLHMGVGKVDVQ